MADDEIQLEEKVEEMRLSLRSTNPGIHKFLYAPDEYVKTHGPDDHRSFIDYVKTLTVEEFFNKTGERIDEYIRKKDEILVKSRLVSDIRRKGWAVDEDLKFNAKSNDDGSANFNSFEYDCTENFHLHYESHLEFDIQAVELKDKYKDRFQICWVPNVGSNYIGIVIFKSGDKTITSKIPNDFDNHYQANLNSDQKAEYDIGVGNVPKMTTWSDKLPKYPITLDLPMGYSIDKPFLLLLSKAKPIKHIVRVKKNITNLLKMREKIENEDGSFEWRDVSKKINKKYFENKKLTKIMGDVTFHGRLGLLDQSEITWFNEEGPDVVDVLYYDTVRAKSTDLTSEGEHATCDLISEDPCAAIFWNGKERRIKGDCSNYTTEIDPEEGENPCTEYEIKLGNRTLKGNAIKSSRLAYKYHFLGNPNKAGYNACAIHICPNSNDGGNVIALPDSGNSWIKVGFGTAGEGEDSSSSESEEESPEVPRRRRNGESSSRREIPYEKKFDLYVSMLVLKRLCYKKNEDGQWSCNPMSLAE